MSVQHAPTPLTVIPERGFKRPGCDDRCMVIRAVIPGVFGRSELLLHDPDAHEDYGAWQSVVTAPQSHTVVTGLLAVNLSSLDVSVNGKPVNLTATELRLLVTLARRVGQAVPYPDLLREVWGPATDTHHLVSVFISRVRAKLSGAGGLISTISGIGLRLDDLPAGTRAPRMPQARKRPGQWATLSNKCLHCGMTSAPHWAHGICDTWTCRMAWRRGWRPEVAP